MKPVYICWWGSHWIYFDNMKYPFIAIYYHIYFDQKWKWLLRSHLPFAQSAGAVEYADCTFAEG